MTFLEIILFGFSYIESRILQTVRIGWIFSRFIFIILFFLYFLHVLNQIFLNAIINERKFFFSLVDMVLFAIIIHLLMI